MRAVRAMILKIGSFSLKHKWPISLQITTQCAYNSGKILSLPYIFNVPNIKRITLILFLQCYILYYRFIDSSFSHMVKCDTSLLRLWRHLHGTLNVCSLSKNPAKYWEHIGNGRKGEGRWKMGREREYWVN